MRKAAQLLCTLVPLLVVPVARAGAQLQLDEVPTVVSTLPPGAASVVQDFLAEGFGPRLVFVTLPLQQLLAEVRSGKGHGGAASVLAFIDGLALAKLQQEGQLLPVPSDLLPMFAGNERQEGFLLPWTALWAPATSASASLGQIGMEDLPFHSALHDRLVVPVPEQAPSVFTGLVRRNLLRTGQEHNAFAWLMTMDARLRGYLPVHALVPALQDGVAVAALAPLGEAILAGPSVVTTWHPDELLHQPLGLAMRRPGSEAKTTATPFALEVATALGSAELAKRLAHQAYLLPAPGHPPVPLPEVLRGIVRPVHPVFLDLPLYESWMHRFRTQIAGHGRGLESLGGILDLVAGGLFVVFLVLVHRHLRRVE